MVKDQNFFFKIQGSKGMYYMRSVLTIIAKDRMVSCFRPFRLYVEGSILLLLIEAAISLCKTGAILSEGCHHDFFTASNF